MPEHCKMRERWDLVGGEYDPNMVRMGEVDFVDRARIEDLEPLVAEINHLRARVAKLETELDGAKQSLNSFFSMKIRAEEEGAKVLDEAISTYLRRAENGGMPDEDVDLVRSVVNDAARIYLWNALVPIICGIASSAPKDAKP
jgi:hypothetical protein